MSRDFHLPGRSPVIAGEGMAATSHPLATLAAIDVLRAGGNAVDAAVTAVAVLCVIEPHMTGIGGDCFALIAEPGKPVWGYNGCGRSGAKASTEALLAKGMRAIEATSPHAVNVPGAIEAWDAILKAHGTLPLDRALAPAIRYAEHGFPVAPRVASRLEGLGRQARQQRRRDEALSVRTAARRREGDVVKLPALAATLKAHREGRRARLLRGPDRAGHGGDACCRGLGADRRGFRQPSRRGGRRRSRPIIAASTWSRSRRTGRASPRW